jgi:site-specific recombinase XerD
MAQISEQNTKNDAREPLAPSDSTAVSGDVSMADVSAGLPSPLPETGGGMPVHLRDLTDRARGYVEAASSANTRRAYASDWKHFIAWCRRQNLSPLPPNPEIVGLYITACASGSTSGSPSGTRSGKPNSVSTIERRLAAISWKLSQRGIALDRKDRAIATVMAGIRNTHATPPRQKEALLPEDLIAMLETLYRGTLRGLRERAMLLIGFAGGLRRSEITGLDLGRDQTEDGRGWIEILDKGLLITLRGQSSCSTGHLLANSP